MTKEALFEKIKNAVVEMDDEAVATLCEMTLELAIPAEETIKFGLVEGMNEVSRLFEEQTYFLPEVLTCSDAMNIGLELLKPHLSKDNVQTPLKIVIGVVAGDTHDIGKNLVKIMLEAAGFEVCDLGKDVALERFIEQAEAIGANIICMSTLMTTTMGGMKQVIEALEAKDLRQKYTVMIGGGPISHKFAKEIGADLYTADAAEAVRRVKEIAAQVALC